MKAKELSRKAIRITNSAVNGLVLGIVVALLFLAGYALWDSEQMHQAAGRSIYEVYKPSEKDDGKSFKDLQAINKDVFAWLTVYGTNIDYPVTQATDNMKYVNTNAEGNYSLTGSIFLDYRNCGSFGDFNSILYGHHMQKKAQFGEIGSFASKEVFDSHRYGNLYFDGKDHGIEFFAFVHTDAYDGAVYTASIEVGKRQVYLDGLYAKSLHSRDIGVCSDDRIILLSTCSSNSTNGRDILVGRITFEAYRNTFIDTKTTQGEKVTLSVDSPVKIFKELPLSFQVLEAVLTALLVVVILAIFHRRKKNRSKDT